MAGVGNAFENSCILTAIGVVAIILNIAVVTRIGRRRFFLTTGLIICGFSQLIVAAVYTVHPGTQATGRAIVGLSVVFIFAYNVCVHDSLFHPFCHIADPVTRGWYRLMPGSRVVSYHPSVCDRTRLDWQQPLDS